MLRTLGSSALVRGASRVLAGELATGAALQGCRGWALPAFNAAQQRAGLSGSAATAAGET